jgi:hypothetical protein
MPAPMRVIFGNLCSIGCRSERRVIRGAGPLGVIAVTSAKIPDETGSSASQLDAATESGAASGTSPPCTGARDTTVITDEARDSNDAASAENESDATSPDEELLRYLFTIC